MSSQPPHFEIIESCGGSLQTRRPADLLKTYERLQRLHLSAAALPARNHRNNLKLEFSKCQSIDAGAILLIMYFVHTLNRMGWKTYAGGQGEAWQIIHTNLSHYLLPVAQRKSLVEKNPGAYLLREISRPNDMVKELEEWAESVVRGTKVNRSQLAMWQGQIAEVITNSFQHGPRLLPSHSLPPVLIAGRSYAQYVQLAALDFGSGIPAVIRKALPERVLSLNDGRVISYACKSGVTSKCDRRNQGAGLPNLIDSTKANGGILQILSLNGLVHMSNKRIYTRDLSKLAFEGGQVLAGTLTIISLNTSG